jgi:hypothetical protein
MLHEDTNAGKVYWVPDAPEDVERWLTKRGKMPDMATLRQTAKLMSARSVLSGE